MKDSWYDGNRIGKKIGWASRMVQENDTLIKERAEVEGFRKLDRVLKKNPLEELGEDEQLMHADHR